MRKATFFGAVGLAALMTAAGVAEAQEKTIKIGFLGSQDDEDFDGSMVFKDYVESRSQGTIAVEIYPNATFCGNFRECVEGVQAATLEVTISTIGGFGNLFPAGQVLDLPYMLRDARVAECVFDGPFVTELRDAVLEDGLQMRLMAIGNTGGWRNFATVNKQITTPEDVAGQKIRTIPADIQQELVRQLGGNPTAVAWPEVYTSLATGVVEGTKNGITDIVNMNFQDHLNFMTLDGHAYMAALWWISEDFWQGLSDAEKRIVYDGFQHLKTVTRAFPMRNAIEAYQAFEEAGGTIYAPTPDEKAVFQEAAGGMRDWYIEQFGEEWLTKYQDAISTCEQEIDAELG
ncbi:MAG: TRAP transporter substrate-binding protein DctP [Geminicoccaceae bacterium]